jgi:Cu2+-exporting ATPase
MTDDNSGIRDGDDARHARQEPAPVPAHGPGQEEHSAYEHPHHTFRGAQSDRDAHDGYERHAGHSVEMFRRKFWGTLLLSIPTLVWAPMIQHWFGYQAVGGYGVSRWISTAFGTLVFAYGGLVFIKGAIGELAHRLPGMMTLIALAISVALGSVSR